MKCLPAFVVAAIVSLSLAAAAFAQSAQQVLTEAQSAYLRGDLDTAKRNFELVLKLDPSNRTAIGYLKMIQTKQAQAGVSDQQQKQLEKLILPKVELREATLGASLDFLRQKAKELSDGKAAVNFVVQVPDEVVKSTPITLSLTNVPFTEVLRYIGNLASVEFVYEKYAIAVKPRGASASAK